VIEGTWTPIEAEINGQKLPGELLKDMKLFLTKDSYVLQNGDIVDEGSYQVNSSDQIDITGTKGQIKERLCLRYINGTGTL
jgi:hypothetical protein